MQVHTMTVWGTIMRVVDSCKCGCVLQWVQAHVCFNCVLHAAHVDFVVEAPYTAMYLKYIPMYIYRIYMYY